MNTEKNNNEIDLQLLISVLQRVAEEARYENRIYVEEIRELHRFQQESLRCEIRDLAGEVRRLAHKFSAAEARRHA